MHVFIFLAIPLKSVIPKTISYKEIFEMKWLIPKNNWLKNIKLNIHSPGTGFALMILALTKVPVGIKNAAEIACIG